MNRDSVWHYLKDGGAILGGGDPCAALASPFDPEAPAGPWVYWAATDDELLGFGTAENREMAMRRAADLYYEYYEEGLMA